MPRLIILLSKGSEFWDIESARFLSFGSNGSFSGTTFELKPKSDI